MSLNAGVDIDDDSSLKEDDEPDRIFVARYLRTITAWTTAVASMIKMQRFRLPMHARLILLPSPQIDVPKDTIHQFIVRMENLSDNLLREHVTAFLDSKGTGKEMLDTSAQNTAIHAEAGLMAIICEARIPKSGQCELWSELRDAFSVSLTLHNNIFINPSPIGSRSRDSNRSGPKMLLDLLEASGASFRKRSRVTSFPHWWNPWSNYSLVPSSIWHTKRSVTKSAGRAGRRAIQCGESAQERLFADFPTVFRRNT